VFPFKAAAPVTPLTPELTNKLKADGPTAPQLFAAVTLNENSPLPVGVPDRVPLLERLRKAGSPVADQVMVASPVAANAVLYAPPTEPLASGLVVVIVGGVQSRMEVASVGFPFASDTAIVKLEVVGVDPLGVPLILPVEVPRVAHVGSEPEFTENVGAAHPDIWMVCE